jgi:Xaa-Pro aminopeptidase
MKKIKIAIILLLLSLTSVFSQPFSLDEFAGRRQRLMEKISNGVAILLSSPVYNRNSDVDYEFRQSSDFYYLSAFDEPESAIIIDPSGTDKFILLVKERKSSIEIWTGKRTGTENAVKIYGADRSLAIENLDSEIKKYISGGKKIYFFRSDSLLAKKIGSYSKTSDLEPVIAEMRLFKSPYEIAQMKRAIDITCRGLIESMKSSRQGMIEYELQAVLEYNFRKEGSRRNGFPSIVGSGPNSCILHYETNNRQTSDGDIVVMDVGAEYDYYSADVTRTFPVNGKFTGEQKAIYNIVYSAQEAGIRFIRPGVLFYQVDSAAREVVRQGLINLGLLKEDENVRKFFMHSTSHWLGMDVHDAGGYTTSGKRGDRKLEPGMVLTVEPGIYIAEGTAGVDPKYYNIGVRIEDDILVTADGYEILSIGAPRTVEDIETVMNKK